MMPENNASFSGGKAHLFRAPTSTLVDFMVRRLLARQYIFIVLFDHPVHDLEISMNPELPRQ